MPSWFQTPIHDLNMPLRMVVNRHLTSIVPRLPILASRLLHHAATGNAVRPVHARPFHNTFTSNEGMVAFNQVKKIDDWKALSVDLPGLIEAFRQLQCVEMLRSKQASEAQIEYRVRFTRRLSTS
jgi:hypothetical protein